MLHHLLIRFILHPPNIPLILIPVLPQAALQPGHHLILPFLQMPQHGLIRIIIRIIKLRPVPQLHHILHLLRKLIHLLADRTRPELPQLLIHSLHILLHRLLLIHLPSTLALRHRPMLKTQHRPTPHLAHAAALRPLHTHHSTLPLLHLRSIHTHLIHPSRRLRRMRFSGGHHIHRPHPAAGSQLPHPVRVTQPHLHAVHLLPIILAHKILNPILHHRIPRHVTLLRPHPGKQGIAKTKRPLQLPILPAQLPLHPGLSRKPRPGPHQRKRQHGTKQLHILVTVRKILPKPLPINPRSLPGHHGSQTLHHRIGQILQLLRRHLLAQHHSPSHAGTRPCPQGGTLQPHRLTAQTQLAHPLIHKRAPGPQPQHPLRHHCACPL